LFRLNLGFPKIRVVSEDYSASKESMRPGRYDKCTASGKSCVDFDECCNKDEICGKGLGYFTRHTKTCGTPLAW